VGILRVSSLGRCLEVLTISRVEESGWIGDVEWVPGSVLGYCSDLQRAAPTLQSRPHRPTVPTEALGPPLTASNTTIEAVLVLGFTSGLVATHVLAATGPPGGQSPTQWTLAEWTRLEHNPAKSRLLGHGIYGLRLSPNGVLALAVKRRNPALEYRMANAKTPAGLLLSYRFSLISLRDAVDRLIQQAGGTRTWSFRYNPPLVGVIFIHIRIRIDTKSFAYLLAILLCLCLVRSISQLLLGHFVSRHG